MAYSAAEVKSGALITVSLAVLLALTFIIGGFKSGKTKNVQVRFGYVNGLEDNAPVYFGGREIGKVDKIEIQSDAERPIIVTLSIPENITPRENGEVFIDTLGLMGEKFVELKPSPASEPALAPGSILEGTDPIPMYLMIQKMNMLADRMDEMTQSLNPMMEQLNDMMVGHQEEIGKIVANLTQTSANVRDMTEDLKHRPWRLVRKG